MSDDTREAVSLTFLHDLSDLIGALSMAPTHELLAERARLARTQLPPLINVAPLGGEAPARMREEQRLLMAIAGALDMTGASPPAQSPALRKVLDGLAWSLRLEILLREQAIDRLARSARPAPRYNPGADE